MIKLILDKPYNICLNSHTDPQREPIHADLNIESSSTEHHTGDILSLLCRSSDSGAQIRWSKLSGRLADNVHISGSKIRIHSLRPENEGVYRCEANVYYGVQSKEYEVKLIGMHVSFFYQCQVHQSVKRALTMNLHGVTIIIHALIRGLLYRCTFS